MANQDEKLQESPFDTLRDFITGRMQMSHIYQPLMLKTLLEHDGRASIRQVAQAFLARDESQIEYYEEITERWPTRVLSPHGLVTRCGPTYQLPVDPNLLTGAQKETLIRLCDQAISDYEEKRGRRIWGHRNVALGEVPGSIRYEVLKRAGFRCDLCGVPADERALEVDHVVPRKHGGTDDPENLQAFCWKCNAEKRASDSTDFHQVRTSYSYREHGCAFCAMEAERVISENSLAYAVRDLFPATPLHSLIIPKRHVADFFELT